MASLNRSLASKIPVPSLTPRQGAIRARWPIEMGYSISRHSKVTVPKNQTRLSSNTAANSKIQPISKPEGDKTLANQRLQRPVAPHLAIYKWQVTSVNSSLQRITGIALSGSLYIFGVSYLASPYLGWDLSAGAMAAFMAGLPVAGKMGVKFGLAWPFMFHAFNSLRHLIWDTGKGFDMKTVYRTGYASAGLSVVTAVIAAVWF